MTISCPPTHQPARQQDLALLDLGFREATADDQAPPSGGTREQAGESIGRYRLLELLGSGGFGNVWLAEQTEPIHRKVALKLIKAGMDSREIIARFAAERQTLALMDHPNIARVLDAGTSEAGRPYFVLELVQGEPITTHCDMLRLGVRERLELLIAVCQAVQHAHQKAILHRDLKPSNILVAEVDGKLVPKVIDFGIAKALGADGEDTRSSLVHTKEGVVVGTPNYMSPEQAGSAADVDTRSDIYALGVILYELLTSTTPLASDLQRVPFDEKLRRIREYEPALPSVCVAKAGNDVAAQLRNTDTGRLARSLRGDLDWVTMKALEKDRQHRYETATALALDLQAHLNGRTVTAAAPTWNYRLGKFARRNSLALVATGLVAGALIAGTVISLWQARQAELSRKQAERNGVDAERNREQAEKNLARAKKAVELFLSRSTDDPQLKDARFAEFKISLLQEAVTFYEELSSDAANDPKVRSHHAWALGRIGSLLFQTSEPGRAADALRKAVEIDESLVAEFPRDVDWRAFLMRFNNLGVILVELRDFEAADAVRKRAFEVAEQLYAEKPLDRDAGRDLVHVLSNAGRVFRDTKRASEAEAVYTRAAQIQEGLVAQFKEPDLRHQLASLRGATAELAGARGDHAKADALYRDILSKLEKWALETPGDPKFRDALASFAGKSGALLCRMGKSAEGLAAMERAVESFQTLAREFPSRPEFRLSAASSRMNLGKALKSLKRIPEAAAKFDEALALQERLASEFPAFRAAPIPTLCELAALRGEANEWDEVQKLVKRAIELQKQEFERNPNKERVRSADLQKTLAEAEQKLGYRAAAFATAWDAAKLCPDQWERWHLAASLGARCLQSVQNGFPMVGESSEKIVAEYPEAIIQMLRNAIENGYAGVAQFSTEEGVPSLAERPDFQALLELVPGLGGGTEDLQRALEKGPVKFTYNYAFAEPGKRRWVRTEKVWIETQPSGSQNTFSVSAPTVVDGVAGTEITRPGFVLFVPQRSSGPMRLMMKGNSGAWVFLGAMEDVE
jgi:eukaryotic-like serine/threonine-protein kinase